MKCTACGQTQGSPKATPSWAYSLKDIIKGKPEASSVYAKGDDNRTHEPEKLYDDDVTTNWAEGVDGYGYGQYIYFYFNDTYAIKEMTICIGSHQDKEHYAMNSRPKRITLEFSDGTTEHISLRDSYWEETYTFSKYHYTNYVKLTIDEVYKGTRWDDTIIGELDFKAYKE